LGLLGASRRFTTSQTTKKRRNCESLVACPCNKRGELSPSSPWMVCSTCFKCVHTHPFRVDTTSCMHAKPYYVCSSSVHLLRLPKKSHANAWSACSIFPVFSGTEVYDPANDPRGASQTCDLDVKRNFHAEEDDLFPPLDEKRPTRRPLGLPNFQKSYYT